MSAALLFPFAPAAAAPGSATAGTGLDLTKYTVYFTGVFEDQENKNLVFTGNLGTDPGKAIVTLADGKRSGQLAAISIDEFKHHIKALLDANACDGNVNPDWAKAQIEDSKKNPIRFVVFGPKPRSMQRTRGDFGKVGESIPLAFLFGSFEKDRATGQKGAYINVICSFKDANIGRPFLDFFHKLIDRLENYQYVKLSALANVITYYPNLGYRFRHDCSEAGLGPEHLKAARLTKDTWPGPRDTEGRPIWPKDTKSAYKIPVYVDFMMDLHRRGFTVKQVSPCDDPRLDAKKFTDLDNDCAEDGFKMVKCDIKASAGETGGAAAGAATGKRGGSRRRSHKRRTTRRRTARK
jgi:hypothetical protein